MQEDFQPLDAQVATQSAPIALPVSENERITSVDVLRGFAVLGILVMNINVFGWPGMSLMNPSAVGGFSGWDLVAYKFETILFSQKFMAIFSMLFGAGLILMTKRAEAASRDLRSVYYRRVVWLIVFGIVHAYFIWEGDILFFYGCCGLWLYMFRRLAAKWLVVIGVVVLLVGIPMQMGVGYGLSYMRNQAAEAEAALKEGKELTSAQRSMYDSWRETRRYFEMPLEYVDQEVASYKSGYFDILIKRAAAVINMQTFGFFIMIGWRVLGLMLIGMGLMKIGLFSAQRSYWFYGVTAALGYGLGIPITVYGMHALIAHKFDVVYYFQNGQQFDYLSSVLIALAHISVVMIVCKAGILGLVQKGLAAVGRTALSNYLLQSVVMTTVFYGYGFNFFGEVNRFGLLGLVVVMWAVNIALSVWWLKSHRYGPAEWLWRRLTYRDFRALIGRPQTVQAQPQSG